MPTSLPKSAKVLQARQVLQDVPTKRRKQALVNIVGVMAGVLMLVANATSLKKDTKRTLPPPT